MTCGCKGARPPAPRTSSTTTTTATANTPPPPRQATPHPPRPTVEINIWSRCRRMTRLLGSTPFPAVTSLFVKPPDVASVDDAYVYRAEPTTDGRHELSCEIFPVRGHLHSTFLSATQASCVFIYRIPPTTLLSILPWIRWEGVRDLVVIGPHSLEHYLGIRHRFLQLRSISLSCLGPNETLETVLTLVEGISNILVQILAVPDSPSVAKELDMFAARQTNLESLILVTPRGQYEWMADDREFTFIPRRLAEQ